MFSSRTSRLLDHLGITAGRVYDLGTEPRAHWLGTDCWRPSVPGLEPIQGPSVHTVGDPTGRPGKALVNIDAIVPRGAPSSLAPLAI
jgi:hypothetical protein